tara:strand:+ start:71136 stop:71381 length:246 start_codon:yes stop_codon:yes gene_type:complete
METDNKEHKTSVEVDSSGECVIAVPSSMLEVAGINIGSDVSVEVCLDEVESKYCILISHIESPKVVVKPPSTKVDEDLAGN